MTDDPTRGPSAADEIYRQLALSIIDGTRVPGSKLPAEKDLAEEFGTSRIIVRQAVHRLADLGLVQVRQGSATRVKDPATADIRIFEVIYASGAAQALGADFVADRVEFDCLYAVGLLDCAFRRASQADRDALRAMVEAVPLEGLGAEAAQSLSDRFWAHVVRMGGNRVFAMEAAWWERIDASYGAFYSGPAPDLVWFYRTLARQLAAGHDPVPYYLSEIRGFLSTLGRSGPDV